MTPKFELGPRFLYSAPVPQVSSSCVYSFGSYRVDKQTNTQTNRRRRKHPTLFATLRRWVKSLNCIGSKLTDACLYCVRLNVSVALLMPISTVLFQCAAAVYTDLINWYVQNCVFVRFCHLKANSYGQSLYLDACWMCWLIYVERIGRYLVVFLTVLLLPRVSQ